MAGINTALRYDPKSEPNPLVYNLSKEFRNKDNADFLAAVARSLKQLKSPKGSPPFPADGMGLIGLMGEYGLIGYSIRRAQEILRVDHTPSYWSHAFLFYSPISVDPNVNRKQNSPWIWESTLEPGDFASMFVNRNGVGPRRFADYSRAKFDLFSPHCVPNIGVIAIGLTKEEQAKIIDRADDPDVDQLNYDLSGLLGTWYAYITDTAHKPNPLGVGNALYCSAYVQLAYDAAGIDLSPGAHLRNTSPEHIWQAAKYLGGMFNSADPKTNKLAKRPIAAWYCARDEYCTIVPTTADQDEEEKKRMSPRTISQLIALIEKRTRKAGAD